MEELVQEFAIWLVKFLVIYAVVFLFVKNVLRRYVFPRKSASSSNPTIISPAPAELHHPPGDEKE